MAMNKKEAAEMERLRQELRVAKALRYSNAPVPSMVPPPAAGSSGYVNGWIFNAYNMVVEKAWTESTCHSRGQWRDPDGKRERHISASQGGISLYPSYRAAAEALRQAVERECAEKLAKIDRMIEEGPRDEK